MTVRVLGRVEEVGDAAEVTLGNISRPGARLPPPECFPLPGAARESADFPQCLLPPRAVKESDFEPQGFLILRGFSSTGESSRAELRLKPDKPPSILSELRNEAC